LLGKTIYDWGRQSSKKKKSEKLGGFEEKNFKVTKTKGSLRKNRERGGETLSYQGRKAPPGGENGSVGG